MREGIITRVVVVVVVVVVVIAFWLPLELLDSFFFPTGAGLITSGGSGGGWRRRWGPTIRVVGIVTTALTLFGFSFSHGTGRWRRTSGFLYLWLRCGAGRTIDGGGQKQFISIREIAGNMKYPSLHANRNRNQ
jgi:hypothetical protein